LESYKEYTFEDPHNRFGGEFDLQKFVSIRDMDNANDKIIKREVQGTL
jgi:hypothetical protein